MVDSLQVADLVNRRQGPGREVSVQPTPAGRHAAFRLLTARGEPLDELASVLDQGEQDILAELLAKLLTRLYTRVRSSERLCRLCDRAGCAASAPCPVGKAEREQGR
ncbi:hypothetical protein [Pseudonocardia sp. T1-2H]|uniref:hypothetical protein n=1 Tax=Pseudonocardia sp. T1-2H TaxID=3128899 RepID=UPI0031012309